MSASSCFISSSIWRRLGIGTGAFFAAGLRLLDLALRSAIRRSMMALMMKHEDPRFAHPFYWAPFVIVGEGGVPADQAISVQ